jgi:hypothetical protein
MSATSNPIIPEPIPYHELAETSGRPTSWLWHGYIAQGAVTLLTSRWKAGKTTLVSILLAKMGSGGLLAGRAVAAGRAVVVSEEPRELWAERGRRLRFGGHLSFLCRPFRGKPTAADWHALIDRLETEAYRPGPNLVVIDTLAGFLPGSDENNAGTMLAALAPLQPLATAGAGVLLLHHPRKTDGEPRGSGALPGFADVLLELGGVQPHDGTDRRRRLRAAGRFPETSSGALIELDADGTDYVVLPEADAKAESFAAGWPILRQVLEDHRHHLTRKEILQGWPDDYPRPGESQLWQWLDRALAAGLVERTGAGRKNEPFQYWLCGRADEPWANPYGLEDLPPLEPLEELRRAEADVKRYLRGR